MIAKPATPPTTPPAIAPVLVEEEDESLLLDSFVDVADVVESVVLVPVLVPVDVCNAVEDIELNEPVTVPKNGERKKKLVK